MNVLKKRNDEKLFLVAFFGNFSLERGIWMLYLVSKGYSLLEISLAQALLNGAMIIGEFPTGIFGDKYGRKSSLIIGRLICIIYLLGMMFAQNEYFIYIIFILYGFGLTFLSGSDEALLYDSLKLYGDEDKASRIGGKYAAVINLVTAVAIVAGGALQIISWNLVFILSILFQLLALGYSLLLEEVRIGNIEEKQSIKDYVLAVGKIIKSSNKIVALFIGYALVNAIFSIYYMYVQKDMENINISVFMISLLFFLASIIASIISSKIYIVENKFSPKKIILLTLIITLMCYTGMLFYQRIVLIIAFFLINMSFSASDPIFFSVINSRIPSDERASLLSAISFLSSIIMVIMSVVIGIISSRIELNTILGIMGIIFTVVATITLKFYFSQIKE